MRDVDKSRPPACSLCIQMRLRELSEAVTRAMGTG